MVDEEWDTSPTKIGLCSKTKPAHAMPQSRRSAWQITSAIENCDPSVETNMVVSDVPSTKKSSQLKMPARQVFTVLNYWFLYETSVDAKLVESDNPSTISSSGEVGPRLKLDEEMKSNYGRRLRKNGLGMSQKFGHLESSSDSVRSEFRTVRPNKIPMLEMRGPIEASAMNDAASRTMMRNKHLPRTHRWSNGLHERCCVPDKYARRIFGRFLFKLVSLIYRSASSPTSPFSGQFFPSNPNFIKFYEYFSSILIRPVQNCVSATTSRFHETIHTYPSASEFAIWGSCEVFRLA